MRRRVLIGLIAAVAILVVVPAHGAPPKKGPPSVSITSYPLNPTTSTDATFTFAIGGSPTTVECTQVPGVGDRFQRSGVLGAADAGGAWSATSGFSTDGQRARVTVSSGTTRIALLATLSADADVSARASLTAVPSGGTAGGLIVARAGGGNYFGARMVVQPGGQVRLQLVRSWLGVESVLGTVGIGAKYKAGQTYWVRLQALGSTIQAKAWSDGKLEPSSWQLSVVDLTPLVGGAVGFGAYGASELSSPLEVVAGDFSAIDPSVAGSFASCTSGTASYNDLALGGHIFRVRVSAASDQAEAIYAWTINPPAPTVTITTAPDTTTASRSAVFEWSTQGIVDATTCSLDGASPVPCVSPVSYTDLLPVTHSFTVTVTNVSGATNATHEWSIEIPAPSVSISSGPPTNTTSRSAEFAIEITGPTDSVTCSLDGELYPSGGGDCRSPEGTVELADVGLGSHTFGVTATNVSGGSSDTWSWTVYPALAPLATTLTPTPAEGVDDPPVLLRFASLTGSFNQALDCDSGITLPDELANDCQTAYAPSETLDCSMYGINELPPFTFNPDPVPTCVGVNTGVIDGSMRQGLYDRFLATGTCAPNNWSMYPNIPAGDRRILYLVVTPEPAFTGSGSEILPIASIAKFYATGWDVGPVGGGTTACADNDPHPLGFSSTRDNGDIWGHFIP